MSAATASLLIYDIPENAKVPNPSSRLRRVAVRVNLSCWVIPNHSIPYMLLDNIRAKGGVWHVVKFDASEAGKLLEMVTDQLRRDVRKAVESCGQSVMAAEDKADDIAEGEDNPETCLVKYVRATSAIIRRTERLLRDYQTAAEGFGVPVVSLGISGALSAVHGIQSGIERKAKKYREIADKLRVVGTYDSVGLANAMDSDECHVGIALDCLQDNGEDTADDRANFAEELSLGTFSP